MNFEACSDAVEECYEYMLAYAAQGLNGDEGSASGGKLRTFLDRCVQGIENIVNAVTEEGITGEYLKVIERDAADSLASVELVMAQPFISSQLIDNLNASIHLRALLTDIFLIDEVVKIRTKAASKSEVALGVDSSDSLLETVPSNNN
jgi:acyl carrier protein